MALNFTNLPGKYNERSISSGNYKYGKISLCYMPKTFSWLEEMKYNINHCLELARSFMKMYNITMFRFNIAKIQS